MRFPLKDKFFRLRALQFRALWWHAQYLKCVKKVWKKKICVKKVNFVVFFFSSVLFNIKTSVFLQKKKNSLLSFWHRRLPFNVQICPKKKLWTQSESSDAVRADILDRLQPFFEKKNHSELFNAAQCSVQILTLFSRHFWVSSRVLGQWRTTETANNYVTGNSKFICTLRAHCRAKLGWDGMTSGHSISVRSRKAYGNSNIKRNSYPYNPLVDKNLWLTHFTYW